MAFRGFEATSLGAIVIGTLGMSSVVVVGCGQGVEADATSVSAVAQAASQAPAYPFVRPAEKHPSGAELVRVIVSLRGTFLPEGELDKQAVAEQRARIHDAQSRLVAATGATEDKPDDKVLARVTQRYVAVPGMAFELTKEALEKLKKAPDVDRVFDDNLVAPSLMQTTGPSLTDARRANLLTGGPRGKGQIVAVLDTGVDRDHPFLGEARFTASGCFSTGSWTGVTESGVCPNGRRRDTSAGAGENCSSSIAGCDHGTHVAGIVGGFEDSNGNGRLDTEDLAGVAPEVGFVAVQVFHSMNVGPVCEATGRSAPCTLANDSDIVAGLDYVETLDADQPIAAVNLSLGGGWFDDSAHCDAAFWLTKWAVDDLRSKRIATVAASGNEATVGPIPFVSGIAQPACISSVVSVGNVTNAGALATSSQSSASLSMLAPGSRVRSSVPGTGFDAKTGTSMATPHVAGAFALMRERRLETGESTRIVDMLTTMRASGRPTTDTRNGVVTPALDVPLAVGMPFASLFGADAVAVTAPSTLTVNYGIARRGPVPVVPLRATVESTGGRGSVAVTSLTNPGNSSNVALRLTPSLDAMGSFVVHVRAGGDVPVFGVDTTIEVGPAQPRVTGFAPTSGPALTTVTIDGAGFSSLTRVRFGTNGPWVAGTDVTANRMTVRVPIGSETGRVQAMNGTASTTSTGTFTVVPTPIVTQVSPRHAPVGSAILVNGANFVLGTTVRIDDVAVADLTIESPERLRFRIPAGATTGAIRITTPNGTTTSPITVGYPTPTIVGFSPAVGHSGQTMTISGSGFFGPIVRFGAVRANVTSATHSAIRVTIPVGVPDRTRITVVATGGVATSTGEFQTDN